MKTCTQCKIEKDLDQFNRNVRVKDGFHYVCRACAKLNWDPKYGQKYVIANPEKSLLAYAKQRARRNGLDFDLTADDVIIPTHCPVLGIPLFNAKGLGKGAPRSNSPAIDRIENSKGYVRGNIVVVSMRANRLKSDASAEELRKLADFYAIGEKSSREDFSCDV